MSELKNGNLIKVVYEGRDFESIVIDQMNWAQGTIYRFWPILSL